MVLLPGWINQKNPKSPWLDLAGDQPPSWSHLGAHPELPPQNKKCPSCLGIYKSFRSSVPGKGKEDQICMCYYQSPYHNLHAECLDDFQRFHSEKVCKSVNHTSVAEGLGTLTPHGWVGEETRLRQLRGSGQGRRTRKGSGSAGQLQPMWAKIQHHTKDCPGLMDLQ